MGGDRCTGRTDAEQDEQDEEDLADGHDGEGEGGEDLAEGLESAEEAQNAQGAHDSRDARRLVGEDERDEGHADDEHVQPAPHILEEGKEPGCEGHGGKLDGEDEGKKEVCAIESGAEAGDGAVGVGELANVLRLKNRTDEALRITHQIRS